MAVTKALILAAGNGSRLRPSWGDLPKPLLPVAGAPLLRRVLLSAREAGIRHFVIVVGTHGKEVENHFFRYPIRGITIEWIRNDEAGTENGVSALHARHAFSDPFLLLMADHIFLPETAHLLLQQGLRRDEVILGVDRKLEKIFDLDDATKVRVDRGMVVEIGKSLTAWNGVDTGMFLCSPGVFESLEASRLRGNCTLTDGMRHLAHLGRLRAFDIKDALWQDVDTPAALKHAEYLLRQWPPCDEGSLEF